MKEIAISIYELTGLSNVASPWTAAALIYIALALYMALAAAALVLAVRHFEARLSTVLRMAVFFAYCLVFSVGSVGAVALQSLVSHGHGTHDDPLFDSITVLMFLLSLAPFPAILAKGGFFRYVQPHNPFD